MDGQTLSELVDQRWSLLKGLLELGDRQAEAVRHSRMSSLLEILNLKQPSLEALQQVSQRLHEAVGDDAEDREWNSQDLRVECRERHRECERMLETLLRQETESEAALVEARGALELRLAHSEGAQRAVRGYAASDRTATAGSRIDISSR